MTDDETARFRAHPDWRLAVQLREYDDRGKVPGAAVPGVDAYRTDLIQVVAEVFGRLT
jgi:predicted HD phosphohydrolase